MAILANGVYISGRDHAMNDVNTLLTSAVGKTRNLEAGQSFLVRDLFKGCLWNRIPRGDRLLLGSLSLSYVGSHDCHISVIDKGVSGQQRYRLSLPGAGSAKSKPST
jgi:hypothetical protein